MKFFSFSTLKNISFKGKNMISYCEKLINCNNFTIALTSTELLIISTIETMEIFIYLR